MKTKCLRIFQIRVCLEFCIQVVELLLSMEYSYLAFVAMALTPLLFLVTTELQCCRISGPYPRSEQPEMQAEPRYNLPLMQCHAYMQVDPLVTSNSQSRPRRPRRWLPAEWTTRSDGNKLPCKLPF
jgi:hypothetical protein